ncbi:FMN-dependent NADH-azoreductase [Methylopila jiangsuensis]|uniref:FMN dependent NADH:quinone oxidoreductase n=1 Tax=Methylopila jiangsuensis TaxID=586230 RepID=A0A9W6JIS1_9HYPH|nr:NAD(P)H-dependent oxidoreductase [Methylopila jiangsuensis]MDR6286839.1 FMN-dependent NADH-azoreductase [Methylopila jiangsuensis]GLK76814.1 FMN-dependent NADH-azoreductase [Methylopila jiangsuensis]
MSTVLHIDASGRQSRSLTRALSRRFVDGWRAARPQDRVIRRDLAEAPPPLLSEAWIAAAFTPEAERAAAAREALRYSDAAIAELAEADLIVLGAPMYNYGMPAALKAWVDQVVRVGRTFSFDLARGDQPIAPILTGKRMVVLSARGEFGFAPGGARAARNHLDPHLATVAPYLGVAPEAIRTVAIEYQEFHDDRFDRSRDAAGHAVDALVAELAGAHVPA